MMYLINYNIKPAQHRSTNAVREHLENKIVKFGNWWHYMDDTWLVDTQISASDMSDALQEYLADKDNLLIIAVKPPYQGWLPEEAWEWLNKVSQNQLLSPTTRPF